MVAKLVSVLASLNQAGIRAKRGTLQDKAIVPAEPVAVVYPEKSAADAVTLAVEVFGVNAVACEDMAYGAAEVLNDLRGTCTVEKCQYSGKTGLFSVKVLGRWPAVLAQTVYLDGTVLSGLTDFRAQATSEVYLTEDGGRMQTTLEWNLTTEELLAPGKAPQADWSGSHTIRVVTDGGVEVYSDCTCASILREGDSRGTVQTRTWKCWERTTE